MHTCAGGALQVGLPSAELTAAAQTAAVQWLPGEPACLPRRQQLENVTNADLSMELGTTLISALAQDNLTVALAMQPNQV